MKLQLHDNEGALISDNTDWLYNAPGPQPDLAYAPLRALAPARVSAHAEARRRDEGETIVDLTLRNRGDVIAFQVRIQLLTGHADERLTPLFLTDNYLTLLPGETRTVQARFREPDRKRTRLRITGWNTVLKDSGHIPIRWDDDHDRR
ncbi:glycoside hydrolase family 2 protein [Streptomyces wuyuanensis]|uniref:glycoside hydrolase family 2 protein n=1 Tax=Streptomyces wuyuanensis TaxID=1196353 RepID=UPI003412F636